jgi:hypothetical protein
VKILLEACWWIKVSGILRMIVVKEPAHQSIPVKRVVALVKMMLTVGIRAGLNVEPPVSTLLIFPLVNLFTTQQHMVLLQEILAVIESATKDIIYVVITKLGAGMMKTAAQAFIVREMLPNLFVVTSMSVIKRTANFLV